jgi:hypothetical protein
MGEEFRIIKGFENYSVSNFGNIINQYPRYFNSLYGLLGMNALSIIACLFGIIVLS